jgi:capsular exopolysaccharide synthesis family protein
MSRNYEILRQAERGHKLFTPPTHTPPHVPVASRLVDTHQSSGQFQSDEEIVKLVQRVFLSPGEEAPQLVVFSAIEPGNGCSWVCSRVGEVLARQGERRVCLVDANLRTPSLEKQFGLAPRTGLTDAVMGTGPVQAYLEPISGGHLWVMTSGTAGAETQNVLSSERFRARLAELRGNFAFVLIDAPPVNRYADAALLGGLADGMILVLEANVTRRETARRVKDNLETAQVKLLGSVLNKRTFPIPESLVHRF